MKYREWMICSCHAWLSSWPASARNRYSRLAGALAEVLTRLTDRDARPAGTCSDIGDRRLRGVLPEVVGLPPGDLVKQVRLGLAVARTTYCSLEFCLPRKAH